jgi:predicted permease
MQTNLLATSFQAIVILLGIGLLGFWVIKRRIIPEDVLGLLSALAINIALPSLVFAKIAVDFSPDDYADWWRLPLWFIFFSMISLALSVITSFVARKDMRHEFAMSLFFQNGMFFPLVVLSGIFAEHSATYVVQLFLFAFLHPSMVFSTYFLFFRKPVQGARWKRIINPVLITTLVALVISLVGMKTYMPDMLVVTLQMLGGMAMPLLIIILGGNIYNDFRFKDKRKSPIYIRENIKFVLVKNIVFPLVFLGILILLRPDYAIALIIILQSAVPPITAVPILTERSGGNRTITSQFIVSSFIFSVISIPAMLYLFSLFFPFPQ